MPLIPRTTSIPYTADVLDRMSCDTPGCDHTAHDGGLFFHGACHPSAALNAHYQDGVVAMTCAVCKLPVADVRVARAF